MTKSELMKYPKKYLVGLLTMEKDDDEKMISTESRGRSRQRGDDCMPTDYCKLSLEELQALQAHHREQMAKNRQAVEERKARTRRLIQYGGLLEKYIPSASTMTITEMESMIREAFG